MNNYVVEVSHIEHKNHIFNSNGDVYSIRSKKWFKPALTKQGYRNLLPGRFVHMIIAECFLGLRPIGHEIDHINRDKQDNRISNLRYVTKSVNRFNKNPQKNNSSGSVGVRQASNGTWRAAIKQHGKITQLGTFKTKLAAIRARKKKERELYPCSAL